MRWSPPSIVDQMRSQPFIIINSHWREHSKEIQQTDDDSSDDEKRDPHDLNKTMEAK